ISLVLEGFIFAYMLSYRLKLLEFKVKDQQKYLLLKNKKEQFGEIIGNIAHQWRQPLNRINLNLAVIDESLKDEIPNKDIIYKKIVSTEKNIHYMSDTIEDFIDFYNPNKEKELFNIYDVVKKALKLLSNRLEGIEVNIFMEKNIEVNGISNEYLQVLLIILNNAIDNFHIQKTRNSKIDISLIEDNNSIVLTIKDNGGGIIKSNIEKVFDPYFTTKYKSEGTGLGLYVAKMLIEDSMDGILDVQVDAGITEFSIKLKR
ncbi:MAG: HAMP domain-containing sensor histidine kinase, partial [Campylobacterota bacterium]|nr:HAMP domain-containing sensor histidine kinase [Campylobacterota bacterium]